MKLIQTGRPLKLARSIVPPPTCGMSRGGAGWPIWNAASGAADDGAAEAEPPGDGETTAIDGRADATAADGAATDGSGVSGAKARSPPSSSAAAATPTTRPATIDRRAHISRGGYQYERRTAWSEGRCYDARPMASLATWIRIRIIPAILTALGITFLAAGMLSFTNPVDAVPAGTADPQSGRVSRRDTRAVDHASAALLGRSAHHEPRAGQPCRHAGQDRGAQDRPSGHQAGERLSGLQRRDVLLGSAARSARPGQVGLSLRPCPDGHVPADPERLEGVERQEDDRHDRRGLDERRPALPVRHHERVPPRPVRRSLHQAVQREERGALAADVRGSRDPAEAPAPRRAPVTGSRAPQGGEPDAQAA